MLILDYCEYVYGIGTLQKYIHTGTYGNPTLNGYKNQFIVILYTNSLGFD